MHYPPHNNSLISLGTRGVLTSKRGLASVTSKEAPQRSTVRSGHYGKEMRYCRSSMSHTLPPFQCYCRNSQCIVSWGEYIKRKRKIRNAQLLQKVGPNSWPIFSLLEPILCFSSKLRIRRKEGCTIHH